MSPRRPASRAARRPRRPRGRAALLAVVTLLAVGAYGVQRVGASADCSVRVAGSQALTLSRTEAMRATTIVGVGLRRDARRAQVARAVSQALRPTASRPLRPREARSLYESPRPSGQSARGAALASALTSGRPALACHGGQEAAPAQVEGDSGLTPRAERVLDELEATFGGQSVGGFAPGGVRTGHMKGSAHYDGRAVDVFFRPVSDASRVPGWAVAQWAVAHGTRLRVATVIYDDRIWSSGWGRDHWRAYRNPSGSDDPVLQHRDHVHVDVLRGR